eukprot:m.116182 g.116182  ORF g.116182 m.116182 type:complete len:396 (-) comp9498_c0_seq1:3163-4350(-)
MEASSPSSSRDNDAVVPRNDDMSADEGLLQLNSDVSSPLTPLDSAQEDVSVALVTSPLNVEADEDGASTSSSHSVSTASNSQSASEDEDERDSGDATDMSEAESGGGATSTRSYISSGITCNLGEIVYLEGEQQEPVCSNSSRDMFYAFRDEQGTEHILGDPVAVQDTYEPPTFGKPRNHCFVGVDIMNRARNVGKTGNNSNGIRVLRHFDGQKPARTRRFLPSQVDFLSINDYPVAKHIVEAANAMSKHVFNRNGAPLSRRSPRLARQAQPPASPAPSNEGKKRREPASRRSKRRRIASPPARSNPSSITPEHHFLPLPSSEFPSPPQRFDASSKVSVQPPPRSSAAMSSEPPPTPTNLMTSPDAFGQIASQYLSVLQDAFKQISDHYPKHSEK